MLSAADAALAVRDRDLPGLWLLLDEDAIRRRFDQLWPNEEIQTVHAAYLRYKPATNCLAKYVVQSRSCTFEVTAKAFPIGRVDRWHGFVDRVRRPAHEPAAGALFADAGVVALRFPLDPTLRSLPALCDPSRLPPLVPEARLGGARLAPVPAQPLSYKPERRFVGRAQLSTGAPVVVRLYDAPGYERARQVFRAFGERSPVLTTRCLAHRSRRRLVLTEWVSGTPVRTLLLSPDRRFWVRRLACALAKLHNSAPLRLPRLTPAIAGDQLTTAVMHVTGILPQLAPRIVALPHRVLDARPSGAANVVVHGDFHVGQALVGEHDVVLVDLDEAALGDAARDVGALVASLDWLALTGELDACVAQDLEAAFVDEYRARASNLDPRRIETETAAALLQRLPRPFRERHPSWPELTEQIAHRATERLERAPLPRAARTTAVAVCWEARAGRPAGRPHTFSPVLAFALDVRIVERAFRKVPALAERFGALLRVRELRLLRWKAGRRALVEFALEPSRGDGRIVPVVGKLRARGADSDAIHILQALHSAGFDESSTDGIRVPEPLAEVPALRLWLQAAVAGRPAWDALAGSATLAPRVADAMAKLHRSRIPLERQRTRADELRRLDERLRQAAEIRPDLAHRISLVNQGCRQMAAQFDRMPFVCVHGDFYPDQLLVGEDRTLWLVDLDLCAWGEAALDAGNFIAHLIEFGVRTDGDPAALAFSIETLTDRFVAGAGVSRAAIEMYTTLSLARHVFLSTQFADRTPFTERLLRLCEERLGLRQSLHRTSTGSRYSAQGVSP